MLNMRNKKINYIIAGVLSFALIFTTIISLHITQVAQGNNYIGQGYYKVFKDGYLIGNISDMEAVKKELMVAYGEKVNQDVYFGDGISVEHVPYTNETVQFTKAADILSELDVRVDGLRVRTMEGKEFLVTSYHDWQSAIKDTIHFIANNDAEKFKFDGKSTPGDIKVVEFFFYSNERIPIEEVMDLEETKEKIIYENTDNIRKDVVQAGDTIDTIATRNNLSTVQLEFANNIDDDAILVPGSELNVTEIDYALNFSYPILEQKMEEIAFEITYEDDPERFKDEPEEIIQEGVNGLADATYRVYIVNGVSEPGERIEYEILSEPTTQIVKRGTKERPVAPSGGGNSAWSVGTDAPYSNIAGFIWPAVGICLSAEYGYYEYGRHNGTDIAGNPGDPIWAAAAGTVEIAGYNGAFGNHVRVNHHNGLVTTYSHMSSIGVNKGQEVGQGTYLGGMGRTGFADGTHLHFEVEADGARLNPRGYLPPGGPAPC